MEGLKFDHHIQSKIFSKLRYSEKLRYKELKDPLLEPAHFIYHLKVLMSRNLVEKGDDGLYQLSTKGVQLAQHFSSDDQKLRFGVPTYTLIFVRTDTKKWLAVKRLKHPHINKYACISGKMHTGETLKHAVKRELSDFCPTINAWYEKVRYCGYASIYIRDSAIETHISGPIWFLDNVQEVTLESVEHGTLEWIDWKALDYGQFIPGWREIVEGIESNKLTYLDLHFNIGEESL